jgi:hypothetical protein
MYIAYVRLAYLRHRQQRRISPYLFLYPYEAPSSVRLR